MLDLNKTRQIAQEIVKVSVAPAAVVIIDCICIAPFAHKFSSKHKMHKSTWGEQEVEEP